MSFTFTRAFPSYQFEWVSQLVSDASGKVVPLIEVVTAAGQHRYVVAIDINAAQHD